MIFRCLEYNANVCRLLGYHHLVKFSSFGHQRKQKAHTKRKHNERLSDENRIVGIEEKFGLKPLTMWTNRA
jgi:hypothetical protein